LFFAVPGPEEWFMLESMALNWREIVLWIGNLVSLILLVTVLVSKRRMKQFPFFTICMGFVVLEDVVLFFTDKWQHIYFWLYWGGQVGEVVLQIAVVVEIARHVFRPFGNWAYGARSFWMGACGISLIAALALTFAASPEAPSDAWAWVIKANFFSVMLICMTSVAVLVAARRYGLGWRNHVMGLAQGWTVLAFATFVVETCHSYLGYATWYANLLHINQLVAICAAVYWSFVFWREEPVRTMTPEMHKIFVDRQKELDYYVGKVVQRPNSRRSS
jgi:hypothetical protein